MKWVQEYTKVVILKGVRVRPLEELQKFFDFIDIPVLRMLKKFFGKKSRFFLQQHFLWQ